MARSHNPFAPKERSKLETPWGEFECASPNKSRLAEIAAVQAMAEGLEEGESLGRIAELAIAAAAAGLENGAEFAASAQAAGDADELELSAIQGCAEFVTSELTSGAAEGNE